MRRCPAVAEADGDETGMTQVRKRPCGTIGTSFVSLGGRPGHRRRLWDEIHGPTGVAPNGIEPHPVPRFGGACRRARDVCYIAVPWVASVHKSDAVYRDRELAPVRSSVAAILLRPELPDHDRPSPDAALERVGRRGVKQQAEWRIQLNGQCEGQATGETFNYEGKTEVLIRHEGRNLFHRGVQVTA
jgi:hypothetical protein